MDGPAKDKGNTAWQVTQGRQKQCLGSAKRHCTRNVGGKSFKNIYSYEFDITWIIQFWQSSGVQITFWTNFRANANLHEDGIHFDPKSLAQATKVLALNMEISGTYWPEFSDYVPKENLYSLPMLFLFPNLTCTKVPSSSIGPFSRFFLFYTGPTQKYLHERRFRWSNFGTHWSRTSIEVPAPIHLDKTETK